MDVDFANVQGLLRYGYGRSDAARYVPLQIAEPAAARSWLRGLKLRDAMRSPERDEVSLNLACSYDGLRVLGLDPPALAQFSRSFQEGMAGDPHRSRVLGDRAESAPARWQWGGPQNPIPHLLLLIYADAVQIEGVAQRCIEEARAHGVTPTAHLPPSLSLPAFKEHFGFTDGIAQPQVEGLDEDAERWQGNRIRLGELLLGYPNEYGQRVERPLLDAHADPARVLPLDLEGSGKRDFGRDGSYLVFRQLRQDVAAWWRYADQATGNHGDEHAAPMIALASKLVGRRPDGNSLMVAPRSVPGRDLDRFDYDRDPDGLGCPLGAHVRRVNPRGSLLPERGGPGSVEPSAREPNKAKALAISRRHRLVRRGRSYGAPLDPALSPARMRVDDGVERGLHFLCLNANIARQFEFLQQAWLLNPKFQGGYDEVDPILGEGGGFSEPALPVRRRYPSMPRFVTVRGGGYFFLPSLAALRYLAGRS